MCGRLGTPSCPGSAEPIAFSLVPARVRSGGDPADARAGRAHHTALLPRPEKLAAGVARSRRLRGGRSGASFQRQTRASLRITSGRASQRYRNRTIFPIGARRSPAATHVIDLHIRVRRPRLVSRALRRAGRADVDRRTGKDSDSFLGREGPTGLTCTEWRHVDSLAFYCSAAP